MLRPSRCLKGRKNRISDAPGSEAKHYVLKTPLYPPFPEKSKMISVGMGCFWCSENLFWKLKGVYSTQVGYQMGTTQNPTYREVCSGRTNHNEVSRIVYDPEVCPLEKILKIFFETHDPTQIMGQGNDRGTQYRSGIYYYDKDQLPIIESSLMAFQKALTKKGFGKIQTEVLPAETFYYAEDYHQQYDAKPGSREYCGLRPTGVSMPKLESSDSKELTESKEGLAEEGQDPKATGAAKRLFKCAKLTNREGKTVPVSTALNGKVVAYYHSAHWCGPCRKFTPKLAEVYSSLSEVEKSRFEIVWRSYDQSEEDFKKYLNEMPWLALSWEDRSKGDKNVNKFIPSLAVYAPDGRGLTKSGTKLISREAIRAWCKLPKQNAGTSGKAGGGGDKKPQKLPIIAGEHLMCKKANGTTEKPPMKPLRWGCDWKKANKICCFNRHFAEHSGYFKRTKWLRQVDTKAVTTYYDSVTGKPLFRAPIGRTFRQFLHESEKHGWPSFRDNEVVWDYVRCLKNGECISVDGTHLGHNLPDGRGNRYCINLVSCAGFPVEGSGDRDDAKAAEVNSNLKLVSLKKYVKSGYVDYKGLSTEEGRAALLECVRYVEATDTSKLANLQVLCFHVNAYNIMCLKGMLEVLDKNPEYEGHVSFSRRYSFFVKTNYTIGGQKMNLYDLENKVIRKMGDARIHMYLNCASMGCPQFSDTWLTPENVDEILNKQTTSFVTEQGAVIVTKGPNVTVAAKSKSADSKQKDGDIPVKGPESIMTKKEHGTCSKKPEKDLRWGCDYETADRICCFNRNWAEHAGYWLETGFGKDAAKGEEVIFYDTVYRNPLFKAPVGRTMADFLEETKNHGWPSFRDEEVIWDHVRVLPDGEVVSTGGTHLGHNLPDNSGNRYCINIVSVAGNEPGGDETKEIKKKDSVQKSRKSIAGIVDVEQLILQQFHQKGVKDRRYYMKSYPKCFVGKDLVDFLVMCKELMIEHKDSTRMLSREDAVSIGQDLLNNGMFAHVVGEHVFKDGYLFYRFEKDGGASRPSGKTKGPMLLVSSIFKWYKSDFTPPQNSGLFAFIREYHPTLMETQGLSKLRDNDVLFRYQMYDWRINSVENAKKLKPGHFSTEKDGIEVMVKLQEEGNNPTDKKADEAVTRLTEDDLAPPVIGGTAQKKPKKTNTNESTPALD